MLRRFGFDYHTTQAQPPGFLDELVVALETEQVFMAEQKQFEAKVNEWRARNAAVLQKQGLRPA